MNPESSKWKSTCASPAAQPMRKLLNKPVVVIPLALAAAVLCAFSLREQMGWNKPKRRAPVASVVTDTALPESIAGADEPAASTDAPARSIAEILATLNLPA